LVVCILKIQITIVQCKLNLQVIFTLPLLLGIIKKSISVPVLNVFEVKTSLFPGSELVSPSRRHASRHTLRGERLIRVSSGESSLVEGARNRQLCVTSKYSLRCCLSQPYLIIIFLKHYILAVNLKFKNSKRVADVKNLLKRTDIPSTKQVIYLHEIIV
jgi:hypothetical protein